MPSYTINSWCYYSLSTVIGTGQLIWTKQANGVNNPGYTPATYDENGPGDNNLTPNELLNPDYSGADATYLGTVTLNGRIFLVFEDEFGQLLGSAASSVPYTDWPAEVDPANIDATVTPICFMSGSLIATATGEKMVQDLKIADQIRTVDGRTVAVKWIGRQSLHKFAAGEQMQPVRIRKGALGEGLPHSDLTVTADHGMILDGLVINASALVNGTTIDWVPMNELPDEVTYYHIETEAHDVILANGAPSETFIDVAGRTAFDNYAEYLTLYGTERIIPEMRQRRISTQRLLPQAIKARLGLVEQANTLDVLLRA